SPGWSWYDDPQKTSSGTCAISFQLN
uniref:Uncharacterized protein n=1 Tax=Solanum lycopersicum TaxID=4081 RepID=A0A3Q7IX49_SOLLC